MESVLLVESQAEPEPSSGARSLDYVQGKFPIILPYKPLVQPPLCPVG